MERPFTKDTKWIICMWDIRGEKPAVTARVMKRRLQTVLDTLEACKADGYYEKVKRRIEEFDRSDAALAIQNLAVLWTEDWADGTGGQIGG